MTPKIRYSVFSLMATAAITAAMGLGLAWPWLISWLVSGNAVAFSLYGWDKRSARRNRFRVPEITLQVMAIVGGSVGAFTAQRVFHHKTKKQSFRIAFWSIVAVQAGLLIWYFGYR